MKKIILAALLLCLFIACTKEPAPAKKQSIADDPVDAKIYDTIPVPIPKGDTSYPG